MRSFDLLVQYDLLRYLFRDTQALLETPDRDKIIDFIRRGLANTDERIREDKPVTPMFLYALFLWFPIQALARKLESEGWNDGQAMLEASQRIVATQQTAFPRRFSSPMKELLEHAMAVRSARTARARRGCCSTSDSERPTTSSCCGRAAAKSIAKPSTGGPRSRACRRKSRTSC